MIGPQPTTIPSRPSAVVALKKDLTKGFLPLVIHVTILGSDDWLQEEYKKIKKNQTLKILQSQLERIEKRAEKFHAMKDRVANIKSNNITNKKVEVYFQNVVKRKELDNKENVQEDNGEDKDLILDEFEEQTELDEEGDIEAIEDQDNVTKVQFSNIFL